MEGSSTAPTDLPSAKGYSFVRRLGDRPVPVYAAITSSKGRKVDPVVIERFARDKSIHDEDVVVFARAARALVTVRPSRIAPLREVVIDADAILLVSEFVDGESLQGLWIRGKNAGLHMPLEIALRIIVDVLTGLEELHTLADGVGAPLHLVHGELAPTNILVQTDGVAKLAHACRTKWAALKVPSSIGYLAPEHLLQEKDLDRRADLYSAGAILFEALTGSPPLPQSRVSSLIRQFASGALPKPVAPASVAWAAPLENIIAKAMSVDRVERYDSADRMSQAIHRAVERFIATDAHVAAWVARLAGSRILARRNELSVPGQPRSRSHPPAPLPPTPVETAENEPHANIDVSAVPLPQDHNGDPCLEAPADEQTTGTDDLFDKPAPTRGSVRPATSDDTQEVSSVEPIYATPLERPPSGKRIGIVAAAVGAGIVLASMAAWIGLSGPEPSPAPATAPSAVMPASEDRDAGLVVPEQPIDAARDATPDRVAPAASKSTEPTASAVPRKIRRKPIVKPQPVGAYDPSGI
jgi:serine/threonine-protein kinase